MKRFHQIKQSAAILSFVLIASGTAGASSVHEHATVPVKWEFSKTIQSKIDRSLQEKISMGTLGLSKFEQRKLDHYGIKVNNRFQSHYKGHVMDVERTTMGLRVIGVTGMSRIAATETIPIRKLETIDAVMMSGSEDHAGHDHAVRKVEWTFGHGTQAKIMNRLNSTSGPALVGLSGFEHTLLDEYGIRIGNTFQADVMGLPYLVTRTSGGLRVDRKLQGGMVAERPVSGHADRF
ncbi:hypothetical protein [Nitrospina gracilis]|uniref:hypothetical protein n=1 Tax=Nitrospina gracilis TaxID=35801 RepID=UPI001F2DE745|nr:hypothetical protein [Nitrospina gracilis]MCF8721438.1 hypothetical protein [Nitrospina gracilis Nb-211]